MLERRSEVRALVDEVGTIIIDEHTTLPCVVHDLSESGVHLTMLSTAGVPNTFILDGPSVASRVCEVVWRTDEALGVQLKPLREGRVSALHARPPIGEAVDDQGTAHARLLESEPRMAPHVGLGANHGSPQ